ncbi:hypothetical protein SEMRO_740_G195490.1 [Seminavis robusta]|uniref:ZSWIM1/3 RNaseH-like domain-containing protein n=1 Tax=Seminavis robusta TaxID=568900 RepID=A0A9N8EAS2_9STRA|nr:hypothetical protein SEMRO_740_G195490.1 [Seminavis robusta]|eukprot:Sro740_g195490.1 n/a (362) ;mRNA; f:13797-15000
MKTYSQEELNLAQTYSQICPAGAAMALTSKATGTLAPSKDQLRYNKSPTSNKHVSQSQALIEYLREQVSLKKMRFVALYHEVTETSLLTISKASMNRRAQQMNNEGVFDEDLEQAQDIQLTYEDSSSTVQQLRLKSAAEKVGIAEALLAMKQDMQVGKKVFLACAWCTEEERKLFQKYPEVLMVDVTFQTNNQGRPLFTSCSPGRDMFFFTPLRAYLPSQCRTPAQSLPKCHSWIVHLHLVTKPLAEAGSKLVGKDDPFVLNQIETFKRWVFTWMCLGGIETDEEFEISHRLLVQWLKAFRNDDATERASEDLKHNSYHLELELIRIMNHKSRWYFPSRRHQGIGHYPIQIEFPMWAHAKA